MLFTPSRTAYTTTAKRGQSAIIVATMPAHVDAIVMVSSNRDDEVKNHTPAGEPAASADDFDVDLEPGIKCHHDKGYCRKRSVDEDIHRDGHPPRRGGHGQLGRYVAIPHPEWHHADSGI